MTSDDVSLSLLGVFALRRGGVRQRLMFAGSTKRLLMLLAAQANHGLRREQVIEEIWPDSRPQRGASSLNTALSRLRTGLAEYPCLTFEVIDDVIRVCVAPPAWIDATELEAAVAAVPPLEGPAKLCPALRARLDRIATTCPGEFLEGCDDHWVLPLRERYSTLLIQALTFLMQDAGLLGTYERGLALGRRILARDPFREGVQRTMMQFYVLNGQRAQAIRQYQSLHEQLKRELGIAPMDETTALHEMILRAASGPAMPGIRNASQMAFTSQDL
jgi:DNA-binding SARP family transcriptional activator